MSDTKDINENKEESITSKTAPYLKKGKQDTGATGSSINNFVIPLVLLLVSTIVIVATLYDDRHNSLVAEATSINDTQTEVSSSITTNNNEMTEAIAVTPEATLIETKSAAVNTEAEGTAAVKQETVISTVDDSSNNMQTPAGNDHARMQTSHTAYQGMPFASKQITYGSYQQVQKETAARRQELARKHNELIQQRRQAYEKEIQVRRQYYEAMMKAEQEKRDKIAKAQKAVFQRVEQNRIEHHKRMQEMRDQISKMHDEIHQIMHESRPQIRNNNASDKQTPQPEQVQRI